jgi:predicted DsbA family dithiol-disulfide isomerase
VATIEVFADIRCPFTHVGLRRLVERREALGRRDVELWIRAWPLELVNGEPLDPALIDEEVNELRAQVAPDLFRGFRREQLGTTSLPALELVGAAYDQGRELGERLSLSLRWALFEEGRDIADPGVLADLARGAGIHGLGAGDPQRVVSDWHAGQRRGVIGSPHFFVAGEGFFCPSLTITREELGKLAIAVDEEGLEDFLVRCFEH